MVEYDVLGNERHKAICKLREMPKLYPGKDGSADVFAWKRELANAIGADTELFSAIRNRLIHLLGGDQPKFSELFGILREDDDAVDARPSDTASADSPVHGSAGCACGGSCGCDDSGEVAPITTELRNKMRIYHKFSIDDGKSHVELDVETFDYLCDAIDSIHRQLESDYKVACDVNEHQDLEYIDLAKRYDKTITLPLDADGLPIRVGDVVRLTESWRDLTVLGVGIVDVHERSFGVFVREGNDYVWYNAEFLHHYVPTVEDVLREILFKAHIYDKREMELLPDLIAECAAKLKLADA